MNFNLNEQQQLIKKTAREFANDKLRPGVVERDEKSLFPKDEIRQMGELGFMGIMISPSYGGAGLDTISYCLALEEIAKVDASAAVIMSVNNSLVCNLIYKYGSDEQKNKYLPSLCTGKHLGAFSLSEPQSGSDASNMLTYAKKEKSNYFINGTKNWVTNGISSNIIILMCLTEKNIGYKGISAFIIEKDFDGISTGKKEDKLGIRGSDTCEIFFNNCKVPGRNLISGEGKGFNIALDILNGGRIGIATQALGIAQESLDRSMQYSKERKQFGKKIAEFGAVQSKIAKMAISIEASRLLIHKAASLKDLGLDFAKEAAMAKHFSSQAAMDCSSQCVQIFGGYGYMRETGVERLMRDAKITQIYEGTSEIQEMVIAKSLLKGM